MCSNWSRRAFLVSVSSAGLAGIAGCASRPSSGRGATDVFIRNEADVARTVEVTVTKRGSESSRIDTSLEIPPNSQQRINNKVIMDSDYDVEVSYTDPTRDAPYSETQAWDDAGKPLHVILNNQIVFAVQIG